MLILEYQLNAISVDYAFSGLRIYGWFLYVVDNCMFLRFALLNYLTTIMTMKYIWKFIADFRLDNLMLIIKETRKFLRKRENLILHFYWKHKHIYDQDHHINFWFNYNNFTEIVKSYFVVNKSIGGNGWHMIAVMENTDHCGGLRTHQTTMCSVLTFGALNNMYLTYSNYSLGPVVNQFYSLYDGGFKLPN